MRLLSLRHRYDIRTDLPAVLHPDAVPPAAVRDCHDVGEDWTAAESPTFAELAAAGRHAPDLRPTAVRHPGYDPVRAAALDAHLASRGGAR